MQSSESQGSYHEKGFPTLSYAYSKLSVSPRNNLFKQIKQELFILYSLQFLINGILFQDFTLNIVASMFFGAFLMLALHNQFDRASFLYHINGIFLVTFAILLFSNTYYTHKIAIYLPQISLITTSNKQFPLILQGLMLCAKILFRSEYFSIHEIYSSSLLVIVLFIILQILQETSLKIENLKAQADSLEEQLKSAQTRLEKSHSLSKDFHLSISHELRNPLNNVMGNIELLQKNMAPGDPNQENIKMAKLGCEILLNALNNTLDFFKTEFNELDINYVSVNIYKCLEKSWVLFSELLRLRGLQGELYLHASVPPLVMIDPGRLHQILFNLIHNSSKFTQKGFVKIIISWYPSYERESRPESKMNSHSQIPNSFSHKRTATPDLVQIKNCMEVSFHEEEFSEFPSNSQKITFSPSMNYNKLDLITKKFPRVHRRRMLNLSSDPLGYLKIQVIDSGVGIHNSNLPKVFQKFSKFSHDAVPRVEGSGLGLWITKKICNKMEGSVHVYSDLNKGSTFLVFLKCDISPQSLGTPTPSPCLSDRRNRTNLQTMATMSFLNLKPKEELEKKEVKPKAEEEAKLRAMVVDDIPYNQELNKKFLEVCGVDVKYIVGNGLEAYKQFVTSAGSIDLIFMDLDMPVMDGKTSSSKIREWEKGNKAKPVVIVILTANCSESELRFCLDKAGPIRADYFYRKPMSLPDCQNLIQQIKRERAKKNILRINLPKLSDHILFYEKDLFQQVLLENYLRVGQVKYFAANKETIFERFTKYCDSICAILYNCEDEGEDGDSKDSAIFIGQVRELLKKKGRKETPILGIIKEGDKKKIEKLKAMGFQDFLVKPFDYESIVRLLRSHTMNSLPI